ncbi:MAG: DUF5660 domain-containing protein [Candidatus Woesebacteria bacterium]|nr:DUF5660 domain-containing protein [Candidatus Woesebacteria bacterium]
MDYKNQKTKTQKQIRTKNILESINEIGSQTVNTVASEVKLTSDEFFKQLLGQQKKLQEKRSGDLTPGGSIDVSEVMSGKEEQKQKLNEQIFFERRLFAEERDETQRKIDDLRIRLQAVSTEALKLASSTANLSQEVKVAIMQNPVNASEYQISFFENIIKIISDFRKKIDNAIVWMQGASKRADKKNYWSQYKKKGTSFLLSGESYSQRSAG